MSIGANENIGTNLEHYPLLLHGKQSYLEGLTILWLVSQGIQDTLKIEEKHCQRHYGPRC